MRYPAYGLPTSGHQPSMQMTPENGIGGDRVGYLVQYYRIGYDHLLSTMKRFLLLNLGLG